MRTRSKQPLSDYLDANPAIRMWVAVPYPDHVEVTVLSRPMPEPEVYSFFQHCSKLARQQFNLPAQSRLIDERPGPQ